MFLSLLLACSAPDPAPGELIGPATNATLFGNAPDFTVPSAGGGTVMLSEHAGDVILLSMSGFT